MNDTLQLATSMRPALTLIFLAALLGLAGCTAGGGGEGDDTSGGNGSEIVQATEEIPPGEQCPYGGVQVESGIDENGNGELDEDEVDSVQFVCNGAPGTLVTISAEPAGENCSAGGVKVESGIDVNTNGVLDAEEIGNTSYVCGGSLGTLVATSDEPPGEYCTFGGLKLESGLDEDGDGVLDPEEIDATDYVCNGSPETLIATSDEPPGVNCPLGGILLETGLDLNEDGVLNPGEVTNSNYLCNGNGDLVAKSPLPPSGPFPGYSIDVSGGNSPQGLAGNGGTFVANIAPGTITGHVKLFDSGQADAAFAVPALSANPGTNPLVLGSGILVVPAQPSDIDEAVGANQYHTHAGDPNTYQRDASGIADVDLGVLPTESAPHACLSDYLHYHSNDGSLWECFAQVAEQQLSAVVLPYPGTLHDGFGGGEYHTHTFDDTLWLFNGTADEVVSGIAVAAGATLIFEANDAPSFPLAASIDVQHDVENAGTIRSDQGSNSNSGHLNLTVGRYIGRAGSLIDLAGMDVGAEGGLGGDLVLRAQITITNEGGIDTSGAAGTNGGPGGDVRLDGDRGVTNTGAITANGGDAPSGSDASGGLAGSITLIASLGDVNNSGDMSAAGGSGDMDNAGQVTGSGGAGSDITLSVTSLGVVRNSGDIVADGGWGDGDAGAGYNPNGEFGGEGITLSATCGGVINSGSLSARGGRSTWSGAGGEGGPINILAEYRNTCVTVADDRDVIVSGNISAIGGRGGSQFGTGGDGGTVTAGLGALDVALGQEVILYGYDDIFANGGNALGDGNLGGGGGGTVFLANGLDLLGLGGGREGGGVVVGGGGVKQAAQQAEQAIGVVGGSSSVVPSGGVYNYTNVTATGGDTLGNGESGGGAGGGGGSLAMYSNLNFSPSPVFEVSENHADIVVSGGDGTTAGGNTTQVLFFGRGGAGNHGDIYIDSGDASDPDGTGGSSGGVGGGKGRTIQIISGIGPAVNNGGLYGRGGNATADGGQGGTGHYIEVIGETATNTSDIDTSGGNGGEQGGTGMGGDAGDIVITSLDGASTEAGSLIFAAGAGDTPGLAGAVYIDNIDVTCDYDPSCNP